MNMQVADTPVQWLFLHLNAFFASCEQQENPSLRGQPVIVVQTLTDSAVAIAASYAAKAFPPRAHAGRRGRRRTGSRPVSEAFHGLQCRSMRGSPGRHRAAPVIARPP